jgi:hypothetical protein
MAWSVMPRHIMRYQHKQARGSESSDVTTLLMCEVQN